MRTATMIVSVILLSGCAGAGSHRKTEPAKKTELLPPVSMEQTTRDETGSSETTPFSAPTARSLGK